MMKTRIGKMNYVYKDGKEYVKPIDVAEKLCSLNVFTDREKETIKKEVELYPNLVESRVLLFPDWQWLLNKRLN